MSKFDITTSVFYRWRYWIGYGSIFLLLVGLLAVAGFMIPSGFSQNELTTLVTTSQLSFSELWHQAPLNMPYHVLQHVSLEVFGPTILGIKLPSLLLGLASAIGLILLLRRWFTKNIAVLASIVAVATGQFLFLSGQGSTGILYLFWPVFLLLFATLVANRAKFQYAWKILFFITMALSLYTPLSVYILIAIGSAIMIHPHLRYIVRKLTPSRLVIGIVLSLITLFPLIMTVVRDPSAGLLLLGIPDQWPNLLANLQVLAGQYFGFMSLGTSSVLLPIFGLASMLIILYGLYRVVRSAETVQSHIILAWIILLLPVLVLNPLFVSIMFVPLVLLLASGLQRTLSKWYDLFPYNPYARIAGLIPLVILVGGMVLFGLERYAYAYRYTPDTVRNFSEDILIIPAVPTVVVTAGEKPLYDAVAAYRNDITITTQQPDGGEYAVSAAAYQEDSTPSGLVTSHHADDGVRFYIYKDN